MVRQFITKNRQVNHCLRNRFNDFLFDGPVISIGSCKGYVCCFFDPFLYRDMVITKDLNR